MKKLDFNMSAEYCSDWSYLDALREVVQNALDLDIDEAVFQITSSEVYVNTFNSAIPIDCFSLGVSKKHANSIGKYGEGLKLAMMILTRLGAAPKVRTSNYSVVGQFFPNEITGVPTFNLLFKFYDEYIDNTHFICKCLPEFDIEEIKKKITPFGKYLGKPEYFDILDDNEGNIYVNGLYVSTDSELNYSYNFSPNAITLNRDRNMVDGITSSLAKAYSFYSTPEKIFDLIQED